MQNENLWSSCLWESKNKLVLAANFWNVSHSNFFISLLQLTKKNSTSNEKLFEGLKLEPKMFFFSGVISTLFHYIYPVSSSAGGALTWRASRTARKRTQCSVFSSLASSNDFHKLDLADAPKSGLRRVGIELNCKHQCSKSRRWHNSCLG